MLGWFALLEDHIVLWELAFYDERRQLADLIAVQARENCELGVVLSEHCNHVNGSQFSFVVANFPKGRTLIIQKGNTAGPYNNLTAALLY